MKIVFLDAKSIGEDFVFFFFVVFLEVIKYKRKN